MISFSHQMPIKTSAIRQSCFLSATPCKSQPKFSQAGNTRETKAKKRQEKANGGDDYGSDNNDEDDDDDDDESNSEHRQSTEIVMLHRNDLSSQSKGDNVKESEKETIDDTYVRDDHDDDDEGIDDSSKGVADGNLYEEPASPTVPKKENGFQNGKKDEGDKDGKDSDDSDDDDDDDDGNLYSDTPINTPAHQPPPDTIFTVEATHRYTGEDVDELNFDPGEIIYVIKFENADEQDDGWLMGIKQSDGIKGVFPENFTRKI